MAIGDRILAAGIPAAAARAIVGDVATGLTGTGTSSQAASLPIGAGLNIFTTVALNSGALLPPGNAGDELIVCNRGGANPLLVFPPVGGQINAIAVNSSFSVAAEKPARFICLGGLNYAALLSA